MDYAYFISKSVDIFVFIYDNKDDYFNTAIIIINMKNLSAPFIDVNDGVHKYKTASNICDKLISSIITK